MKQWLLIVLATLALTACNTMRGIGQDVSKGGRRLKTPPRMFQ